MDNTNKREYDKNDKDNNGDIKKQKIDETISSLTLDIEWDMIDISLLDDRKLDDIIIISNSIGISTSEYRKGRGAKNSNIIKQHLINRIKFLVETNNQTINNQIVRNDNNPFDKTSFSKLVIDSETTQGKNELLFWKVFKNKPIYKHIMSYMNILPNSIPYEYIIHVEEMINGNQISLLKYKVKRNEYLEFNLNEFNWNKLFSNVKQDNDDCYKFYNCLFGNYKLQILQTFKDRNYSNFQPISKLLLTSNCSIGLKVLIDGFNFIPTVQDLKISNIQCFKVLVNTFTCKTIIQDHTIALFKFNPLQLTLNDLIETIGLLDQINGWELYENSKFKYQTDKTNQPIIVPPIDIIKNEIKQFKFSSQQLSSKLVFPINYISNERNDIKKLLDIYYRVGNGLKDVFFIEYNICYGEGIGDYSFVNLVDNNGIDLSNQFNGLLLKLGFIYSHFPTFKYACSKIVPSISLNHDNISIEKYSTKELKHQFLKTIIQDKQLSLSIPYFLFYALIYQDDLELLESYLSNIDTSIIKPHPFLSKYLKSMEMINYLFNEHFNLVGGHYFHSQIRDINLIRYYETKLNEHQIDLTIDFNNGITVEQFQFIINNPIKYQIYKKSLFSIKPIDFKDNIQLYYKSLKDAIISNPNITFKITLFFDTLKYPPNHLIEFLIWLDNYKFEGISFLTRLLRTIENSTIKSKTIQYYLYGGDIRLFKNCDLIGFIDIVKIAISRGDTKTLDKLLNILIKQLKSLKNSSFESNTIKTFIFNIIKASVENSQLLILRHLYCNHNQIFKIENDVNGTVSISNIEKLISIAFEKDNIRMNELLFNIYIISKSKLEKKYLDSNSFIILEKYFID